MSFDEVIAFMEDLKEDGVPKNVQKEIDCILVCLNDSDLDKNTKINKVLAILDDITNDANLSPHSRTQFWNVSSTLESMLA